MMFMLNHRGGHLFSINSYFIQGFVARVIILNGPNKTCFRQVRVLFNWPFFTKCALFFNDYSVIKCNVVTDDVMALDGVTYTRRKLLCYVL